MVLPKPEREGQEAGEGERERGERGERGERKHGRKVESKGEEVTRAGGTGWPSGSRGWGAESAVARHLE